MAFIVGVNVAVFLGWVTYSSPAQLNPWMMDNFSCSLKNLRQGRWWTLVTNQFSHMEPAHLAMNMVTLVLLGMDVLRRLGPRRFLGLYISAGTCSALGHVVFSNYLPGQEPGVPWWKRNQLESVGALGASGSVQGITAVFACLYPTRIVYLNLIVPVPAILLVGGFIAYDFYSRNRQDGVAHFGHLGGAVYGIAFYLFRLRRGL